MMRLIENAREAFESAEKIIPTELKVQYLNQLLGIGYFAIDVARYNLEIDSPFSDFEEVLSLLDKKQTKILILAETQKEVIKASENYKIDFIEIPFSLLDEIKDVSLIKEKIWVGISIDFSGEYDLEDLSIHSNIEYCKELGLNKIKIYNSSKSIKEKNVKLVLENCKNNYSDLEFGVHFYAEERQYRTIFESAFSSGCLFFESGIKGWAKSKLGASIPTEKAITYLNAKKEKSEINILAFESAYNTAKNIFSES